MCAHRFLEPRSAGSRIEAVFTRLGGGHWRALGERHERSTYAVAGVVVLFGAALACLVATLVVADASIFRAIPRANTNLPTMGAAECIASTPAAA